MLFWPKIIYYYKRNLIVRRAHARVWRLQQLFVESAFFFPHSAVIECPRICCRKLFFSHFIVLCSSRGRGFFRLLGTVSSAKAGGYLRGRGPRRSLEHFHNRRECLPSVELRIGNPLLFVGHHKSTAVQSHVVQVQDRIQSECTRINVGGFKYSPRVIRRLVNHTPACVFTRCIFLFEYQYTIAW